MFLQYFGLHMKFLFWVRQRRTQNSVRHLRWNVNYTRKTSHFRCWADFWIRLCSMKLPEGIQLLLIVGDKAKGRISRQVFQENKARQIFRKTNISYSLIRALCLPETPVLRFEIQNKAMIRIRCSTQWAVYYVWRMFNFPYTENEVKKIGKLR